ncbi:MAG: SufB/SufD family protein [Candidatus Woesearchaeota archaeon]
MANSIPQVIKPSLVYGLGVVSPFMEEDRKASTIERSNNNAIGLLSEEKILEDIPLEKHILSSLEYDNIMIDSDKTITLGSRGIIIDAKNNATITVHIKHDDNRILGILSSAIIIKCNKSSNITLIIVQDDHEQTITGKTAFFLKGIIGENATLTINELVITGNDSYRKSRILLKGDNAKVYPIHGIFSYNNSKIDAESDVDHDSSNSESDMKIRAIISDNSSAIIQGDVTIKPNAHNSNGYQQEDIILLGENAVARPIPNLEIGNHDVKCSHGATVSNVDEETLYYAMSRGISREDALSMLISSFLSPVLGSFPRELLTVYEERISRIVSDSLIKGDS